MDTIRLTRKNIQELFQVIERFQDVEHFEIVSDSSSGIGPCISVKFTLFNKNQTTVDITDVSSW
jgi:hypothetical protein